MFLCFALCGCGDTNRGDAPALQNLPKKERVQFQRTPLKGAEKEALIQKARETVAEGDEVPLGQWVEEHLEQLQGDALFQTWDGARISPNRYDIRFTFTHVDKDGVISLCGFTWSLDLMLGLVGTRQVLSEEQLEKLFRHKSGAYRQLNQRRDLREKAGEAESE